MSVLAVGLTLGALFSGEAVLQRDATVNIWGSAPAGQRVEVMLHDAHSESIASESGRWDVSMGPFPAGGPFDLVVRAESSEPVLSSVWFGDVFLCSGQSNMQWTLRDTLPDQGTVDAIAALEGVFLHMVPKEGASTPRMDLPSRWQRLDRGSALGFSGVAVHFAAHLKHSSAISGVPIGLIDSSFGGTRAEAWISRESLRQHFDGESLRDSFFGLKPASMHGGMIAPLQPGALRGVLWYQGESNSSDPRQYERLMTGLIADWRRGFRNDGLPFLIVELPNFAEYFDGGYFTWIREAQANVARQTPGVFSITTIDTADGVDLHPKEKEEIGRRLALVARRVIYGETTLVTQAPAPASIDVEGGSVVVEFPADDPVAYSGGRESGFMVSGATEDFRPARVVVEGNRFRLLASGVERPVYIRYAWEGNPPVTLRSASGFPVAPFRTDDFPPGAIEIQRMPAPWRVTTAEYDVVVSGSGRLASWSVQGSEMIDSVGGVYSGAGFDSAWGPVRLLIHERLSATELRCHMESGAVRYSFGAGRLGLRIANHGGEPAPFRIPFADGVSLVAEEDARRVRGTLGKQRFLLESSLPGSVEGQKVVVTLAAGASAELALTVLPPGEP